MSQRWLTIWRDDIRDHHFLNIRALDRLALNKHTNHLKGQDARRQAPKKRMLASSVFLERTLPMDGSRLVAWAIVLMLAAFGMAVVGGPQAFISHITQVVVESPTAGLLLGTILSEITLFAWDVFPFAVVSLLLWIKVR
jgi:hypothetical protein